MTAFTLHDLFAARHASSVERFGTTDGDSLLAVAIRLSLAELPGVDTPEERATIWTDVAQLAIERLARSWIGVGGVGTVEGDVAQAASAWAFALAPAAPTACGPLVDILRALDTVALLRTDTAAASMIVGLLRADGRAGSREQAAADRAMRRLALTTALAQGIAAHASPLETTRDEAIAEFAALLERRVKNPRPMGKGEAA